ncbi:MAG: chitobiase/beta-hexosaminidase C-terminal domain-containing protein [Prevotella sp.]|nr:chitobiase/beta-hexosaminidase C-terminal domain-containing protein [Prevotella sp.]
MKQILRLNVLLLLMLTGVLGVKADVTSLAEMKAAKAGCDYVIPADHPIYVISNNKGDYLLYDGTAGLMIGDYDNYLGNQKSGSMITAGTIYFGFMNFGGGYTYLYKSSTGLTVTENATIPAPMDISDVESFTTKDAGTYFTAHGSFVANGEDTYFTTDNGLSYKMTNYFKLASSNFASYEGKTGTLTAVVTFENNGARFSPLTSDFFVEDGETPPVVAPASPTFDPVSGTELKVGDAIVINYEQGTDVYYTMDGTEPTLETGILYVSAIQLDAAGTYTIKAIAVKDGVKSEVATATYEVADDPIIVETKMSFREMLNAKNTSYVNYTMPDNAQVLRLIPTNRMVLWDGTAAILVYMDNLDDKFTNLSYEDVNFYTGYTGFTISGKAEMCFEENYYDFYIQGANATFTFGTKSTLTPITVTGAEAIKSDKSNLYAYVQMHGTMNGETFTADDGTEFTINENFETGVKGKSGAGTIKAMVGNPYGSEVESVLTIVETKAWTADPTETDFEGEVMSLAELKTKNYDTVRFKFEQDKVQVVATKTEYGFDYMYLWDGTDGVLINGYLSNSVDFNFEQGQIVNGGIEATYNGSYGNALYFNQEYSPTNELVLNKDLVKDLIPLKKTLAEVTATMGEATYEFSYLAIDGKIENGKLVSGNKSVDLSTSVCATADLTKYEGQTGTFYGLYQSRGVEALMPISEYYFVKAETTNPTTIAELLAVEDEGDYTLSMTEGDYYKMQILAVEGTTVYLWDGADGVVTVDLTENIGSDKVGSFIYGDVVFGVSNPYGDGMEYTIKDLSNVTFSEPADFLPAIEKANMHEGDFVKFSGTIEAEEDNYFVNVNGNKYWLFDSMVDVNIADYVGKTGTVTAICGGLDEEGNVLMEVYPELWFVEEDEPQPAGTFAELMASVEDGTTITVEMPENAQMLYEFITAGDDDYECVLWDGTAGIRIYANSMLSSIITNREAHSRNFGKKVTGSFTGTYEAGFEDFYVFSVENTMLLGEEAEVTPLEVEGADCMKEDKSMLHSYVKMSGEYDAETSKFVAADGTEFVVDSEMSTVALPTESGKCTIKAMFAGDKYGGLAGSSSEKSYLFLLEETAVEFGEVNAINGISVEDAANGIYTLDGRFVGKSAKNLAKGIYVVNGKKVAVK